jgi:hypothetical protein
MPPSRARPSRRGCEAMITAKDLERIKVFEAGDLPVVSLYVGLEPDPAQRAAGTRVSSLLHELTPWIEDRGLPRAQRMSIRGDVARIRQAVTRERWTPGTTAVFSCSGADLFEEVALPRSVRDRVVVDATPWVRPMLAVLDEYHRSCVLVLDGQTARPWEFYLGELEELGGAVDHETMIQQLPGLFAARDLELLVLGGEHLAITAFEQALPRGFRDRVAGAFTADPSSVTKGDVKAGAGAVVAEYERDEERRWVADVMERAEAGGLDERGLERCLWAGSLAAIQDLLVQDGVVHPGVICDESRWLAAAGDTCPICGREARRTPDVIDELVEVVIDEGGTVEHVQAQTPLQEHGVAASLRFPLPLEPGGASLNVPDRGLSELR